MSELLVAIGGAADGKRVKFKEGQQTASVSVTTRQSTLPVGESVEESMTRTIEHYTREKIFLGRDGAYLQFAVLAGMSVGRALAKLINSYAK